MGDAGGGDQAVDGADLNAMGATPVAKLGGGDMGRAGQRHQRERGEGTGQAVEVPTVAQPVQQLLQDIAGRDRRGGEASAQTAPTRGPG